MMAPMPSIVSWSGPSVRLSAGPPWPSASLWRSATDLVWKRGFAIGRESGQGERVGRGGCPAGAARPGVM